MRKIGKATEKLRGSKDYLGEKFIKLSGFLIRLKNIRAKSKLIFVVTHKSPHVYVQHVTTKSALVIYKSQNC